MCSSKVHNGCFQEEKNSVVRECTGYRLEELGNQLRTSHTIITIYHYSSSSTAICIYRGFTIYALHVSVQLLLLTL